MTVLMSCSWTSKSEAIINLPLSYVPSVFLVRVIKSWQTHNHSEQVQPLALALCPSGLLLLNLMPVFPAITQAPRCTDLPSHIGHSLVSIGLGICHSCSWRPSLISPALPPTPTPLLSLGAFYEFLLEPLPYKIFCYTYSYVLCYLFLCPQKDFTD